jgi:hypothetical protein
MHETIGRRVFGPLTRVLSLAVVMATILFISLANGEKAIAQIVTAEEKGLPPNSTFAGADVDTVNLQNGNLHISIPIYTD